MSRKPRYFWTVVPCPTCGAGVGQVCHYINDPSKKIETHAARRRRVLQPGLFDEDAPADYPGPLRSWRITEARRRY